MCLAAKRALIRMTTTVCQRSFEQRKQLEKAKTQAGALIGIELLKAKRALGLHHRCLPQRKQFGVAATVGPAEAGSRARISGLARTQSHTFPICSFAPGRYPLRIAGRGTRLDQLPIACTRGLGPKGA